MAAPPNNMPTTIPRLVVTRQFLVEVRVDVDNPKAPSLEQLENRLGDGPQWMDGVLGVHVEYLNRKDS